MGNSNLSFHVICSLIVGFTVAGFGMGLPVLSEFHLKLPNQENWTINSTIR